MNRNDWVFVGVRLWGMYLAGGALLTLPYQVYYLAAVSGRDAGPSNVFALLSQAIQLLVGILLLLGASKFSAWLERKDARNASSPS